MNILWITNSLLPSIKDKLGIVKGASGGWMEASAKNLLQQHADIELAIVSTWSKTISGEVDGIRYYTIPADIFDRKESERKCIWNNIVNDFNPDVVHIHGTEFSHGLSYLKDVGGDNVIISIQGLVSVIERYIMAGITLKDVWSNITVHEILTRSMLGLKKHFKRKGECEKEYIRCARYIIGRTLWDKTHVKTVNPNVEYFHCNETLRSSFYNNEWKYENCNPHTIFFSQAATPLKGFHILLKALPIIKKEFPDVKVRVAGSNIIRNQGFKDKLRQSTYAKILDKLIKKYNLADNISFTGILNEKKMVQEYLNSNVFVCASSIENSSNSIGEAQILGVPCVCSYVGGTPSIVEDGKTGILYRFEEYEMLAQHIIKIFRNQELVSAISKEERAIALERHDAQKNTKETFEIYKKITDNNKRNG